MREGPNQNPDRVKNHPPPYYRTSLFEWYIAEAMESKTQFGPGNFLYVCLAALLELHLSTAPTRVFHFRVSGRNMEMIRKYRRNPLETTKTFLAVSTYPDLGWRGLRIELDHQRHTLRWMTRFFQRHFKDSEGNLHAAFKDISERFKLRVQDLEQIESQLRDQLASEGIDRSVRMAEISIRESKRVMLCMLPAVPFSSFLLTGSK
jgi:hypothetical protein